MGVPGPSSTATSTAGTLYLYVISHHKIGLAAAVRHTTITTLATQNPMVFQ